MKHRPAPLFLSAATASLALLLGACSQTPEPATAVPPAPQVADIDVTTHVKTALQREDSLKAYDISVSTTNGDVLLSGIVDSQAQIDTATRLARDAEGAHSVHDELTLKH